MSDIHKPVDTEIKTDTNQVRSTLKSFALVGAMVLMVGAIFVYEIYFSK